MLEVLLLLGQDGKDEINIFPVESKFNSEMSRIGMASRSQKLYYTVFESTVNTLYP